MLKVCKTEIFIDSTVDAKVLILEHITKIPGIRHRELLRLTGLSNGTLEYHLKILERMYRVNVDRHGSRRARYYPMDIPSDEAHIIGYVRNVMAWHIKKRNYEDCNLYSRSGRVSTKFFNLSIIRRAWSAE